MTPITPVVPGVILPVTEFAASQPEYETLPAYRHSNGRVITRWRLTWPERFRILLFGDLWLSVLTFNKPLQPVRLDTECPIRCESSDPGEPPLTMTQAVKGEA